MTTSGTSGTSQGVKIKVHPALCEGWGECHRWGGAVYPLDDEGCVDLHLLDVPPEMAEAAWMGAAACPNGAIVYIGEPAGRLGRAARRSSWVDDEVVP